LDIPEKFLDDISDGDYLLESLRDFRPPTSDQRTEGVSFFDGKGRLPDKLHVIGGAPGVRGQKMNEDSLDDLKFFDKPVDNELEKDKDGFKKVLQKDKQGLQPFEDDNGDSGSANSSRAGDNKGFNPLAQYRQKPKKSKDA
jgi:hypothetical protein